jgi:hypothetical protein
MAWRIRCASSHRGIARRTGAHMILEVPHLAVAGIAQVTADATIHFRKHYGP